MAFGVCAAPPSQTSRIRVAKGSIEGSMSQEEGKGKQVKNDSQAAGRARPSRMGKGTQGESVESVQAPGSLLEGHVVCPNHRGI